MSPPGRPWEGSDFVDLQCGKNIYAFWADAFVLIFSLPVCRIIDSKIREYVIEYEKQYGSEY